MAIMTIIAFGLGLISLMINNISVKAYPNLPPMFDSIHPAQVAKGSIAAGASRLTIYFAGIVRTTTEIKPDILEYMVELSCEHQIVLHIVTGKGGDGYGAMNGVTLIENAKNRHYEASMCAEVHVTEEPDNVPKISNRIERISVLRDFQRELLRTLMENHNDDHDSSVVVLADLDLYSFPDVDILLDEIDQVSNSSAQTNFNSTKHKGRSAHDVVCSAGIMYRPFGYYDTYATVLLPDTFVYPLKNRLVPQYYPKEDTSLVCSNNTYGEMTQWDLLDYFENESRKLTLAHQGTEDYVQSIGADILSAEPVNKKEAVPVKSCFGGLAVYKSSTWLNAECKYNMDTSNLERYANLKDNRPCEHVVFHNCLLDSDKSISIAVQPSMRTEWKPQVPFGSRLYPSKTIHDSLITYYKQKERGDRLANGSFTLRINTMGRLVVEEWITTETGDEPKVVWTAPSPISKGRNDLKWTHMFLLLKPNGNIILKKQLQNTPNSTGSHLCDSNAESCRITLWESQKRGPVGDQWSYSLFLDKNGNLAVIEENSGKVLWTGGVRP